MIAAVRTSSRDPLSSTDVNAASPVPMPVTNTAPLISGLIKNQGYRWMAPIGDIGPTPKNARISGPFLVSRIPVIASHPLHLITMIGREPHRLVRENWKRSVMLVRIGAQRIDLTSHKRVARSSSISISLRMKSGVQSLKLVRLLLNLDIASGADINS